MPWFSLLLIAAIIITLIDAIRIDEDRVRFMPKVVWILLIILIPLIGIVLWFALGRGYQPAARPVRTPRPRQHANAPAGIRSDPVNITVRPVPSHDGRTTEQQLADLEREIEEDKRRAALEHQFRAEIEPSHDAPDERDRPEA